MVWRGLGKFFGSTIFIVCLVFAILLMGIVNLTSHDSITALAGGVLQKQLSSSGTSMDTLRNALLLQCLQTDKIILPFTSGLTLSLNCNDIRNADTTQFTSIVTKSLVDSLYYRKFGCNFSNLGQCVSIPQNQLNGIPLFFISDEGNQFFNMLSIYMWIGSALGLALLLASIQSWTGRLKGVGLNLAITGLPFLFLDKIQSAALPPLPSDAGSVVKPILDNFTSSVSSKFVIIFVIGVALLVVGYGIDFYRSRKPERPQGKRKK